MTKRKPKTDMPAVGEEYVFVWRFTCADGLIHGFWGRVRSTP